MTVPADTPVARPVVVFTLMIPALVLLHEPPPVGLVSVAVSAAQREDGPLTAPGAELTVCSCVVKHPGAIPVTTPEPVPMVAIAVLLLVHVPDPTLVLWRPVVVPTQVVLKPVIGSGNGATSAVSVCV